MRRKYSTKHMRNELEVERIPRRRSGSVSMIYSKKSPLTYKIKASMSNEATSETMDTFRHLPGKRRLVPPRTRATGSRLHALNPRAVCEMGIVFWGDA